MRNWIVTLFFGSLLIVVGAAAQTRPPTMPSVEQVAAIYPEIEALYLDLHQHPELSMHEQQTAAKLAERLKALGYQVTTGVGSTGIVAILKNGDGPAVMLRTDMDALPVEEKTGLPYASKVTTTDTGGASVSVMHACGHDVHMSSWYGTAKLMATNRQRWHGTLILIGQPAEETGEGAVAMLRDGLFTRFPKPNYALAIHDDPTLPAGQVGFTTGYAMASSDSVDVTIYGRGGHGAQPQDTVDPIVIGARTVMALQTIVSREIDPRDPAVVTVGVFNGGTKNNIIPDEVQLQLTVRSYKPGVRKHLLASIERIVKGEAMAGGSPKEPLIKVTPAANATYNDPELTQREVGMLKRILGETNVVEIPPKMVFEDFSEYTLAGVASTMFFVGGVEPAKFAAAAQSGTVLPGLHSSLWAPDREPTLKTAITAETAMLMDLMGK
ncbi:MAG: amidohydrolase [Acidobacteria bacterium]|nr:MAG: amidohydrolase [Acidobacteriota bacterium]